MAYFANILADPAQVASLKKFDFSSCRLNDTGLIYLINALQNNKQVCSLKLTDNFFSENVEAVLLETLNKNISLTEICLQGNRFSHSCLQKLKKIATRNQKIIEEQEPNKLKAEIYRLRYEQQKLDQAKNLLTIQEAEIEKIQKYRKELKEHMNHFKQEEENKRQELAKQIAAQKTQILEKERLIQQKNDNIAQMEQEFEAKMEDLKIQFNQEKQKKQDLDRELTEVKEELENIETKFPQEVSDLREQIEYAKQQTLEFERKTKELQTELNALRSQKK